MDIKKDYYKILGVSEKATADEIKKVFKNKAKTEHPDVSKHDNAKERFQELNEAYETLSDDNKRREYDMMRKYGSGGGFRGFGNFSNTRRGMDEDIYAHYAGFANRGFYAKKPSRDPQRGQNIVINVTLPFEEMFFGCTKTLDIKVKNKCKHCKNGTTQDNVEYVKCPKCGGEGIYTHIMGISVIQETCPNCGGTGTILKNACTHCRGTTIDGMRVQTINIDIPKCSTSFSHTYDKLGNAGLYGGAQGDITINITIGDNGLFIPLPNGNTDTLFTIHYISVLRCMSGGVEKIMTPYGYKDVYIEGGIKNGEQKIFHGFGIKKNDSEEMGDLCVKFIYDFPENCTDEEEKMVEKIMETMSKRKGVHKEVDAQKEQFDTYENRLKNEFSIKG